jgi:hypothetical protein
MGNWYSDVFTNAVSPSAPKGGYMAPAGRQGYPRKISRIDLTGVSPVTSVANLDVFAMQPVNPDERLVELHLTVDALFNAGTSWVINTGLWKLNADRTVGAVIDLDLFQAADSIDATAIARTDEFTDSASLGNLDRGKRIWELAETTVNLSPLEGRGEQWVIGISSTIVGTVSALGVIQLETVLLPV